MNKYIIIVFLFFYSLSFAQDDYKILSSTASSLIVEFSPKYLDTSVVKINSNLYRNTLFKNASIFGDSIGMPEVPSRILSVGVPGELGNNLRILSSNYTTLSGFIKPMPSFKKQNDFAEKVYNKSLKYSTYKNPDLIEFGDFGKVRELNVQDIVINPVQFDVVNGKIKYYTKIVFQINYSNINRNVNSKVSNFTSDAVINRKVVKFWGTEKKLSKISSQNSVLAEGDWYKFEAPEEGIYKIDKSFLSDLGISVNSIDPRTIKIYNNGGYILPWTPSVSRPTDLVENAIYVSGEADGNFGDNDYILFYGRGVDFWEYNPDSKKITRNKHFYTKHNYYWLTFGGANGKRMSVQNNSTSNAEIQQKSTVAFKFRDEDKENVYKTGLLFVEDDYTNASRTKTYTNSLNEIIPDSTINYTFQFVNGAHNTNNLTIDENGNRIITKVLNMPSSSYIDYRYGTLNRFFVSYQGVLPEDRSVLKFTFTPRNISDKGHLDYIEIEYYQNLSAVNDELLFFSKPLDGVIEYSANNFSSSGIKVFNISDFSNVSIVNTSINGGTFKFKNSESSHYQSKYFALHTDKYKKPENASKESNSNLRGISNGVRYIIIVPKVFKDQAERLSNYRSNTAKFPISSKVVYIEDIYNEFSGGLVDPTSIRDFLKYAYENWTIKPEYVLLFGDGDYDYFNTEGKNRNFIPTFQQTESLYDIGSYPYDDFYTRISGGDYDEKADLGIGRLSVTTTDEAKIVVDKIINYETNQDKGLWRNRITLLADDGQAGFGSRPEGDLHVGASERLSENYIPQNFDRKKIYLSNYQTINTGLGRRKPDCNQAIIEAMNNGTLIFNYFGHGNPDVWAHEYVFERSVSIPQLKNKELFFLTAATCDFGRYDDPNLQSATEEMILLENAGMIGGISAVRPVFAGQNEALNDKFYSYMLGRKDSSGYPLPIGKAYFLLKQAKFGDNDEKFHLFCDPALRLNIPELPAKIVSVNNSDLTQSINIKALSNITIKGKIEKADSSNSNFNGEGIVTVYDSKKIIHLEDINANMEDQGGVIFRGRVSVENGDFATSFTVPKDISYENQNGKIIAYFFNEQSDGVGYTNNITVGGTDSSNINDNKGPDIDILFDDKNDNSYLVTPNFKLVVKLFDDTGLNTTGTGIGHKLEAILNDDEQNSIDLTKYFIGDLNSGGKSGEVDYNFSSLDPGDYKIKINAWDVYNNFSSKEDYFTVVDDAKLVVRDVYNYPNPFRRFTYFTFQHNLNDAVNVKIKIYTIAGRIIKEIYSPNIEDKFVKIEWNGKDEDNNTIGNGTYLYKLMVQTIDGKYKENILGKMAVIR